MSINRKYFAKVLLFLVITLLILIIHIGAVRAVSPPSISNEFPADNATDIELNPTLTANIGGDSVHWTVQLQDDAGNFQTIIPGGTGTTRTVEIPTTTITQYDYYYSWKIIAIDSSGQTTEKTYTFRTRELNKNYPPFIRNPQPANNSIDVSLNTPLQVNIKDIDGNQFTWTVAISSDDGQNWDQLDSGNAKSGETNINVNITTIYDTLYLWKVSATDKKSSGGSGQTTTSVFNFRTTPENHMPDILNLLPANQAIDVPLSPTLSADITDFEGNPFNWTIEIQDGRDWIVIGSGGHAGPESVTAQATADIVNNYESDYTWRVSANDSGSGNTNRIVSTFRTRKEEYAPTISNVTPFDGQTAVSIFDTWNASILSGTSLSAYIEDKDNQTMTVIFSWLKNPDTNEWEVLDTQTNTTKTFKTSMGRNKFTNPNTTYTWKVSADDHTPGGFVEQEFSFTTGGLLVQKWSTNIGNAGGDQIMPVMGDINGDGDQELVMDIGGKIVSVNGSSGQIEWSVPGGSNTAVELVDINKDGIPEVLTGMNGPYLRALNGKDGSQIWKTRKLKGESFALFPIMAYDIDGDGYPTIYFASEDQTPLKYSGNLNDYTGALSMIDHNGNVLKDTWIFHPCWGGMSLGDPNFDGHFVLYLSDRRAQGYLDNNTAKGPQAYDAKTLELLWSRPDIMHSSPIPIIADVVGDNKLEVVLTPITNAGPVVVNALTGKTISGMDYSNNLLPTHGVATVYDIDYDGDMEIIMASSYPDNAPPEFAIFDLITGKTKFRPVLDNQVAWAPKVGDVDGDGKMEILVAEGSQGSGRDFPLLIYKYDPNKQNYILIDRVDPKGLGQLMPARVYDTDGDGLNEVVVVGYNGILSVYDTPAPTPNPAPRTWLQMYSEYRQGAAEYVPPPGPPQPIIKETNIKDGAIGVQPSPTLSVHVVDFRHDLMNIGIATNASGTWETVVSNNSVGNGWYNFTATAMNQLNHTYYWRVSATDLTNKEVTTQTFSFTITPCNNGFVLLTYYVDHDSDGYGNNASSQQICEPPNNRPPTGYVLNNTDCNDANSSISPGAPEICDGVDNNCNGKIDELDAGNGIFGNICDCGNGIINTGEQCDNSDFGGKTCVSYGHNRGTLKCTSLCVIDSSGCSDRHSSGGGGGGGGGGSSTTNTSEDWNCGNWSECVDGKQTQVCTHKTLDAQKTNTQVCSITAMPQVNASTSIEEDIARLRELNNLTAGESAPKESGIGSGNESVLNSTAEVPEITGAATGSTGPNRPVWGLALMVLGMILAIALAGFNIKKKGIEKKPTFKTLEEE